MIGFKSVYYKHLFAALFKVRFVLFKMNLLLLLKFKSFCINDVEVEPYSFSNEEVVLLKELLPPSVKPNFTSEIKNLIAEILILDTSNIDALFFQGLDALLNQSF